MSPASKSKSKDRSNPRAVKEQSKVSIMKPPTLHSNNGNTPTANAYNPVLGTFRNLDISPPQISGRFRSTDDPDDHSGSSPGTTLEYDSMSNNDSSSGDSEDQKEKLSGESEDPREKSTSPTSRVDIPGCDNDKRDKIRQKNERKHQRQRERRAQELHERCSALLISRKLEALSNQLVAMGFPSDRATVAIILNEGRMEESVSWLLHEVEEGKKQQVNLENKSTLKIDISNELARISELEVKYKCSKQDVERAVLTCEGDLLRAEDNLVLQKQSVPSAVAQKSGESDSIVSSDKMAALSQCPVLLRTPMKAADTMTVQQLRQDRRDPNHVKSMTPRNLPQESANKNAQQSLKVIQVKSTDRPRPQVSSVDKRWLTISSAPSASHPLNSTVQASLQPLTSTVLPSQVKLRPWCGITVGNEVSFQAEPTEPFIMQQPKPNLPSSSIGLSLSPPSSAGWNSSGAPSIDILTTANPCFVHNLPGTIGTNGSTPQQFYHQNSTNASSTVPAEFSASAEWRSHMWNASGNHLPLATPSSLGLFTGRCSAGSSAQNDWKASGNTSHPDYTAIDWSLDLTPLRPSFKVKNLSDTWSVMFSGGNSMLPPKNRHLGAYLYGLQGDSDLMADPSASVVSREWSNPFEGMDLFRVPRQYVTSPSL